MKNRYTRQQIIESIKHWTKQLHLMNENYNAVIDALIDEFGHNLVTSRKFDYTLTQSDLKKIFKILNKHLFNDEIGFLPVVLWPMEKLVDKLNYHAKMSGPENQEIKKIDCLGVHTSICTGIFNDNEELIDIKFRDTYLIINSSEVNNNVFIFAVSIICHEMIHAYDHQISNEIHDLALNWEKYKKEKPNYHNTKMFKEKMKEANINGINVTTELSSDKTHKIDNIRARYVLENVIGEDEVENHDYIVRQSEHDLMMINKKTGYGFFAHFD